MCETKMGVGRWTTRKSGGISYSTILIEKVSAPGVLIVGDGSSSESAFVIAHPGKRTEFAYIFEHRYSQPGVYRVFAPFKIPPQH